MKTTPVVPVGRWLGWAGLAAARAVYWPAALAVLVVVLAVLAFRLMAERARRRTLIQLVERSPGGTLVVQDGSPYGAAMYVRVGGGRRSHPHGDGGSR